MCQNFCCPWRRCSKIVTETGRNSLCHSSVSLSGILTVCCVWKNLCHSPRLFILSVALDIAVMRAWNVSVSDTTELSTAFDNWWVLCVYLCFNHHSTSTLLYYFTYEMWSFVTNLKFHKSLNCHMNCVKIEQFIFLGRSGGSQGIKWADWVSGWVIMLFFSV